MSAVLPINPVMVVLTFLLQVFLAGAIVGGVVALVARRYVGIVWSRKGGS